MLIKSRLLYAVVDGKKTLVTQDGTAASIDALLRPFTLADGIPVPVLIVADDGRHDQQPFTIEAARLIISSQAKGHFSTADGQKVKIYSVSAAGDYPVVGLGPDGRPCLWDASGIPKEDTDPRLYLQIERRDKEAD